MSLLTTELAGARLRLWNSERPLVFVMVVLVKANAKLRFREVRDRLAQRMKWWQEGEFAALVQDAVKECTIRLHGDSAPPSDEQLARAFNAKVLSGRLRQAVRSVTNRSGGGVLDPESIDS